MTSTEGIRQLLSRGATMLDGALVQGSAVDPAAVAELQRSIDPIRDVLPLRLLNHWDQVKAGGELPRMRSAVSQAQAAVAAIDHAGGRDAVIAAGGLDAVAGAADVYRNAIFQDLHEQYDAVRPELHRGASFGFRFTRAADRKAWMEQLHPRVDAFHRLAYDAGINRESRLSENSSRLEISLRAFGRELETKYPRQEFQQWFEVVDRNMRELDSATLYDSTLQGRLLSTAQAQQETIAAVEASGHTYVPVTESMPLAERLQHGEALLTLADRYVERIENAGRSLYGDDVARATHPYREGLADLRADLSNLAEALDHANEQLADDARELTRLARQTAGKHHPTPPEVMRLRALVTNLHTNVPTIAADPSALEPAKRAVASISERFEGGVTPQLLRDLLTELSTTEHPHAVARTAIRELLARSTNTAPVDPTDAAAIAVVTDEIRVLLTGLRSERTFEDAVLPFDDPSVRQIATRVLELMRRIEHIELPIPEEPVQRLSADIASLNQMIERDTSSSWGSPAAGILRNVEQIAADVAKVDAEAINHGVKSVSPSERPQAAALQLAHWQTQRLDRSPDPTTIAAVDERIRETATRLELIAALSETADRMSSMPQLASEHLEVNRRIAGELHTLTHFWQLPDDTSKRLVQLRRAADEAVASGNPQEVRWDGSGTTSLSTALRAASGELVSWTFLDGGHLATSDADRLTVAMRRSEALGPIADDMVRISTAEGTHLAGLVDSYRRAHTLIGTIIDAGEPFLPQGALDRLRSTSAVIEHDLDNVARLQSKNRFDHQWVPTYRLYRQLEADFREIDSVLAERFGTDIPPSTAPQLPDLPDISTLDGRWSYLERTAASISSQKRDLLPFLDSLASVKADITPDLQSLYDEAAATSERTWARVHGVTPEGEVIGYGSHPDYADLGRLRSSIQLLIDLKRDAAPAGTTAQAVTW